MALEQIGPFPYEEFINEAQKFAQADFVWVQEEHMNYGPWTYIEPRINNVRNIM